MLPVQRGGGGACHRAVAFEEGGVTLYDALGIVPLIVFAAFLAARAPALRALVRLLSRREWVVPATYFGVALGSCLSGALSALALGLYRRRPIPALFVVSQACVAFFESLVLVFLLLATPSKGARARDAQVLALRRAAAAALAVALADSLAMALVSQLGGVRLAAEGVYGDGRSGVFWLARSSAHLVTCLAALAYGRRLLQRDLEVYSAVLAALHAVAVVEFSLLLRGVDLAFCVGAAQLFLFRACFGPCVYWTLCRRHLAEDHWPGHKRRGSRGSLRTLPPQSPRPVSPEPARRVPPCFCCWRRDGGREQAGTDAYGEAEAPPPRREPVVEHGPPLRRPPPLRTEATAAGPFAPLLPSAYSPQSGGGRFSPGGGGSYRTFSGSASDWAAVRAPQDGTQSPRDLQQHQHVVVTPSSSPARGGAPVTVVVPRRGASSPRR